MLPVLRGRRSKDAAAAFAGDISQIPPMVSALKFQGKPLYKLAREGKCVERAARQVRVYSIHVADFAPGSRAQAEIVVRCSSGTYIRTICADIGDRLGCGGHMSMLERERVGRFEIGASVSIDSLQEAADQGRLAEFVTGIDAALVDSPAVNLDTASASDAVHGMAVELERAECDGETVRILGPGGVLIGLGSIGLIDGRWLVRPRKVLAEQ